MKFPFTIVLGLTGIFVVVMLVEIAPLRSEIQSAKRPRIEVASPEYDFGKITDGDIVSHTFQFSNVGNDTLRIYDVRASCGCTAALLSEQVIAPGKSGEVKTTFNSKGKVGRIKKTIYVNSNDPDKGTVYLHLLAQVDEATGKTHETMMSGSYFEGQCVNCHVEPAAGKTGEALFVAVCAMCHGEGGTGGVANIVLKERAPKLTEYYISDRISRGSPSNAMMKGFSKKHGGPLDDTQIKSLVHYLKGLKP